MLKKSCLPIFVAILFILSGCTDSVKQETEQETKTIPPVENNVSEEDSASRQEEESGMTSATESESDASVFELTKEERTIYENYVKTLDKENFRDVSPVSIAKIFIQCGVEGEWEAEYNMYSEDGLTMSKAEYQSANEEDIETLDISSRKDMADYVFSMLGNSEFVDDGDGRGHIDFEATSGTPWTFRLIKNSDGIWEVKYNPFDEY